MYFYLFLWVALGKRQSLCRTNHWSLPLLQCYLISSLFFWIELCKGREEPLVFNLCFLNKFKQKKKKNHHPQNTELFSFWVLVFNGIQRKSFIGKWECLTMLHCRIRIRTCDKRICSSFFSVLFIDAAYSAYLLQFVCFPNDFSIDY